MCPMCRKSVHNKEIEEDLMAYNLIGEIEVHCNNIDNGCLWNGTIAELTDHLNECIYPANKMPKWLKDHIVKEGEFKAKKLKKEESNINELITIPQVKKKAKEIKKTRKSKQRVKRNRSSQA